jgi:hypothetical protein
VHRTLALAASELQISGESVGWRLGGLRGTTRPSVEIDVGFSSTVRFATRVQSSMVWSRCRVDARRQPGGYVDAEDPTDRYEVPPHQYGETDTQNGV